MIVQTMKQIYQEPSFEWQPETQNYFHKSGSNTFFVNSTCVMAENQIITLDRNYLLFDYYPNNRLKIIPIKLMKTFNVQNVLVIQALNMLTGEIIVRAVLLTAREIECPWTLLDVDYFNQKMDAHAIKDFCEKN
jgi:hypothetical protein